MKIFANAEKAAKKAGDAFVTVERLLLACVLNADKNLKTILTQAGLEPSKLTEAIKSIRRDGPVTSEAAEDQYEALSKYARDLTQAAREHLHGTPYFFVSPDNWIKLSVPRGLGQIAGIFR